MKRHIEGFTYVELMITLAIMAVLATVCVPMSEVSVQREKEHQLRAALIQIREALDAYKKAVDLGRIEVRVGESGYPHDLKELVVGIPDIKSATSQKIYFLRAIPKDPFFGGDGVAPEETWGLRSYESSPEDPQAGADVFDVYSKSAQRGSNGISYRQW